MNIFNIQFNEMMGMFLYYFEYSNIIFSFPKKKIIVIFQKKMIIILIFQKKKKSIRNMCLIYRVLPVRIVCSRTTGPLRPNARVSAPRADIPKSTSAKATTCTYPCAIYMAFFKIPSHTIDYI